MARAPRNGKYAFASLDRLFCAIETEKSYRIQIFSLEAVELFEKALSERGIKYVKSFVSSYAPKRSPVLLLKDSPLGDAPLPGRVLYYSNSRDSRFVPYKFKVACDEKARLASGADLGRAYKNATLTALLRPRVDAAQYAASALNYVQSVVLFCMTREKTFAGLCKEIRAVDERLTNKFLIYCELNSLLKLHICRKSGASYAVALSTEAQDRIYEAIGFKNALADSR